MHIRELRLAPDFILLAVQEYFERHLESFPWPGEAEKLLRELPSDACIVDVALDHGHHGTHRAVPPKIVLQLSSDQFQPE